MYFVVESVDIFVLKKFSSGTVLNTDSWNNSLRIGVRVFGKLSWMQFEMGHCSWPLKV